MKAAVKSLLAKIAPRQTATIQAIRARRYVARLQNEWGLVASARQYISVHGEVVRGGPFVGMQLPYSESFAGYLAMLVGSLEMELHPVVHEAIGRPYKSIINVGCAEGYYAVGLARAIPIAQVHAFDIDPWARRYCRNLADLNGVTSRVHVHGWCDHRAITEVATASMLVVCDCEGYEFDLLDPAKCRALADADIIVELHDFSRPGGVTAPILDRFRSTHEISLVEIADRDAGQFPWLDVVPQDARRPAISEARNPHSRWAWLKARR